MRQIIEFGDNVRVRRTPLTEGASLAGLVGQVYGHTTPSITGVNAIGQSDLDLAYNVHVDERDAEFWLAPDLLECVDHGAGADIRVGEKRFVRAEDGEWIPETVTSSQRKERWWRRRSRRGRTRGCT